MLKQKGEIKELHALWDSTIYEWDQDFKQPLSEEHWKELGDISALLRKEHTYESMKEALEVPRKDWPMESHKIVVDFVYNIEEYTLPSDDYVKKARKIVHQQLAKGGYRLAKILIGIFDPYE